MSIIDEAPPHLATLLGEMARYAGRLEQRERQEEADVVLRLIGAIGISLREKGDVAHVFNVLTTGKCE